MYLAPKINRKLDGLRDKLQGVVGMETVQFETEQALKPWGVNVLIDQDPGIKAGSIALGGLYDFSKKRRPIDIILYHNSAQGQHNFTEKKWREFRFSVSQVLQHELIHKTQYSHRVAFENGGATLYYDIKAGEKSDKEHMDYLAELDEIDAYAHDIAMEILEYYPNHDPYKILGSLHHRRFVWSYNYYKKAFKHSSDWSEVRDRLLKKTYQWLPYVVV
jgi:hypothetical protein